MSLQLRSRVTKAIYHIINFNWGSPGILLQYLVIYGITILFFPGEAGVQRLVFDNLVDTRSRKSQYIHYRAINWNINTSCCVCHHSRFQKSPWVCYTFSNTVVFRLWN